MPGNSPTRSFTLIIWRSSSTLSAERPNRATLRSIPARKTDSKLRNALGSPKAQAIASSRSEPRAIKSSRVTSSSSIRAAKSSKGKCTSGQIARPASNAASNSDRALTIRQKFRLGTSAQGSDYGVVSASQPRLDLREGGACLSIDDVLAHLDRRLTGTRLEEACAHVDTCGACRIMMAEAARLLAPDGGKRGAPSTLAEGERVGGGRYEIRRFIARGGMGEIYEALDSALGEIVALKTLAITTADQADAARRLLAEVRIARKVVHPNVCRILELGTHHRERSNGEAIPFLTMPLL